MLSPSKRKVLMTRMLSVVPMGTQVWDKLDYHR
jgi:hypothetical protein